MACANGPLIVVPALVLALEAELAVELELELELVLDTLDEVELEEELTDVELELELVVVHAGIATLKTWILLAVFTSVMELNTLNRMGIFCPHVASRTRNRKMAYICWPVMRGGRRHVETPP